MTPCADDDAVQLCPPDPSLLVQSAHKLAWILQEKAELLSDDALACVCGGRTIWKPFYTNTSVHVLGDTG